MSMKYVPGRGYVDEATDIVVGSQEWQDRSRSMLQEKNERIARNTYNPDKRWTHYNWLKGSADRSNPSFAQGPNSNWMSAMRDRAKKRLGGDMTSLGWYEMATQGAEGMDQIWNRNNGIESLLNQGYSLDQVGNFLNGGEIGQKAGNGRPWYEQLAEQQGFLSRFSPQQNQASSNPVEKARSAATGGMLSGIGDMRQKIFEQLAGKFGNR
jgi:hypothetical protein